MDKLYIGDEFYLVDGPEDFARILGQKLGPDAEELFRSYLLDALEDDFDQED